MACSADSSPVEAATAGSGIGRRLRAAASAATRPAFLLLGLLPGLLALTACAGDPPPPEPAPPLAAYVIGAGDRIKVTVLELDDMTTEADVANDGTIELPLVGSVRAGGRTTDEIRATLTERLSRDFIKEPKVNVEVTEYRPFYVLGQVNKPGSYPFEPELDIRKAVAIAGGFNRRADTGSAYLVRETDGGDERRLVGLGTRVFPGDVIEVDRRLF